MTSYENNPRSIIPTTQDQFSYTSVKIPEGRRFITRLGEFLNLPNPSGRSRPWGLLSL
jgi:hypothetical protein